MRLHSANFARGLGKRKLLAFAIAPNCLAQRLRFQLGRGLLEMMHQPRNKRLAPMRARDRKAKRYAGQLIFGQRRLGKSLNLIEAIIGEHVHSLRCAGHRQYFIGAARGAAEQGNEKRIAKWAVHIQHLVETEEARLGAPVKARRQAAR
ncbi:hypothetical protein [Sphingopyxis sp. MWB1]|uniref:hypothetical protein n=1 Tax=Sphingopyxis sp. MWB1 TaxID=1537715 RepID=UPI001185F307|nr:hypothetical protein [Sphingopyxis sp. MWB1]